MAKTEDAIVKEYIVQGTMTISEILKELGELDVVPFEVRTGLDSRSISHDSLYSPYIGVLAGSDTDSHYLFTIASMAGWAAEYDPKCRGVMLRRITSDVEETLGAWAILLNAARLVMGEIRSR